MKRTWVASSLITFILFSCSHDKIEPMREITTSCDTIDIVSFSQHILPLLNANCNMVGCHSGSNPEGNLNLEPTQAYLQLMKGGKGYIDTLKPEFSVMYAEMNSVSNPMPPKGKLDSCKLNLVLKWIQQKAKNN